MKNILFALFFLATSVNAQLAAGVGVLAKRQTTGGACTTTNLLNYTQQIDNAYWDKNSCTITANATTAPDATTTADAQVEGNIFGYHILTSSPVTVSNGAYTYSMYIKANGRNYVLFDFYVDDASNGYAGAYYNIASGSVGSISSSGANLTGASVSVTSEGSGWYRCVITATKSGGTTMSCRVILANDTPDIFYDPAGATNGVYVWGAQLEASSSVHCYKANP